MNKGLVKTFGVALAAAYAFAVLSSNLPKPLPGIGRKVG